MTQMRPRHDGCWKLDILSSATSSSDKGLFEMTSSRQTTSPPTKLGLAQGYVKNPLTSAIFLISAMDGPRLSAAGRKITTAVSVAPTTAIVRNPFFEAPNIVMGSSRSPYSVTIDEMRNSFFFRVTGIF